MWDNRKPTNRAPNEPAKSFYMCSGKHIFGQKWPFSVQRSLLFCEGAKVLVPIYQKPLTHLVCIVLLVGHCTKWIRKANIWPKMTTNAYFLAKFGLFWAKNLNFYRRKQKFWYPCYRTTQAPCSHCILVGQSTK